MGKAYAQEMDHLSDALIWASSEPILALQRALAVSVDRGLLPIGSGGSFTAAVFAAALHFRVTGHVSRPLTPLETYELPRLAHSSATGLLLSAEGKNQDILGAAEQLLLKGVPALGITLRPSTPLQAYCEGTGAATVIAHQMPWGKDGYLATSSLIATLVILARAYEELGELEVQRLGVWFPTMREGLRQVQGVFRGKRRALVLHGIQASAGAIDLESKLSESGLAFAQICDYRQFAHGRHLQLLDSADIAVISMAVTGDRVAETTLHLLPAGIRERASLIDLPIGGYAFVSIASVLAAMAITEAWARESEVDPGQPPVPLFGRELHALNASVLSDHQGSVPHYVARKIEGCNESLEDFETALDGFIDALGNAEIKALVCDFDGTLCDTMRRFENLSPVAVPEICRLLEAGIPIALATGRGNSIEDDLKSKIQPKKLWRLLQLGCYSGSHLVSLEMSTPPPAQDGQLTELAAWLYTKRLLKSESDARVNCGQLSVRRISGDAKQRLLAAIYGWLADRNCTGWRVLASGHSIDILSEDAGKLRVVEAVSSRYGLDSDLEILRLGDAGDFSGNDFELLGAGLGLSVDAVTADPNTCWNLLPPTVRGVQGAVHYLSALTVSAGTARFKSDFLENARVQLRNLARQRL